MTPPLRDEVKIRVGIPQDPQTISVAVPAGDAPPWDLDTELSTVGTDVARVDAVPKVTGRARYTQDVRLPGMLHGALLRSPHPRATVRSVDVSAALRMPGVRAALPTKGPDTQFRRVHFAGDDVAAVAAETLAQALDALEKVVVEYEVEPHQTDWLRAEGAPSLSPDGEVTDAWPADEKIDAALASAAHTCIATYRTEVQTHSSLEPHGVVADFKDGALEVWASTQATFGVRAGLEQTLGLEGGKVRVHSEFVGGGFGSKFAPGAEAVAAALLSRAAGAPVKLMLSRTEEHTSTGNRPPAVIQIRAGSDSEGNIVAWDYRSWGGPGHTGRGGSTKGTDHYCTKAQKRTKHQDVRTDTDPARAMRAPGWPQGFFASESMMDELALACGMNPFDFRLRNDAQSLRAHEWKLGAERFRWSARYNPEPGTPRAGGDPRRLRGAGLASARWGQMGGTGNHVTCRIHTDGTVEARNGAQDIGTGMKTVMAVITAEELQIPVGRVRVAMGDTNDPVGPASGGSTTTPSLAPTVRHAAYRAKQQLVAAVARHLQADPADVTCAGGKIGVAGGTMLTFDEACRLLPPAGIEATGDRFENYAGYQDSVCGCQFAEVEVDRETGTVRVLHMLAVQDCGLVIAKKLAESQVLGAMIQGISYALHEQRVMDHDAGRMLNVDLLGYKIACAPDMPELDVVLVPVANGKNSVGAAGLGEPPAVAPAAAIANAVANAIGARVRSLPITPDKVLAALQRGGPR
jgi:xanthine dehydrogenase YagR molybdenum-binding subunit